MSDSENIVPLEIAVPPSAAEDDLCRIAGGTANRHVFLLLEDDWLD